MTLLVMGAVSYQARVLSNESERWVEHTHEVLENLQDLELAMETAKSSYREFALIGDESALQPFHSNEVMAMQRIAAIRNLTMDNASQQRRIVEIERLAVRRFQFEEMVIALRRDKGPDAAADAVRNRHNLQAVGEFNKVTHEAQAEELRLLGIRDADATKRLRQTKASLVALTVLSLLIVLAAGRNLLRESLRRTLTEQLLDSEEATAALLDLTHDAIFVRNLKNEIIFWNKSAEGLYGWSKREVLGRTTHELLQTAFPAPLAEIEAEVFEKSYWEGELVHQRRDGTLLTVSSRWAVQTDGAGKPVAILESNRDVSQRQREDRRFRGLMEAAPDAMVVVNQDGEIVLLNVRAEKQFGYGRDELLGRPIEILIPQRFLNKHPGQRNAFLNHPQVRPMGQGRDLFGLRKDGSEFPIEIMLSPSEDTEGTLVIAAIRDITVRKVAEEHLMQMEGRGLAVEASLQESEERYRMLLDGIQHYAVFAMDSNGLIVSWNKGAERIKGYKAEEIIGQHFRRFFLPKEIADGRPEEVLRVTAANGRYEEQCMRVRKDGSRFLANVTFAALRDSAGNLRGFSEFSYDLSESKESEARYRGLLEAAPDAMVVVNQVGEIVLLNLQAERKFGYSRDELVGQEVTRIVPEGFAERLIADGTRTATEALLQQMGAGIELSGRRKDGSRFPIEIMLSPLTSAEGILVTAAIRDITVRKAEEENLRQSEERMSLVVTNATDYAILMLDLEGRVVSWNDGAERIKGYRAEEIIGRNYSCFYPAEAIRNGDPALHLDMATRHGRYEDESWRVRKDGSQYYANVVVTALRDKTGQLRGFGKIVRDITERVRTEEHQAKAAGELKRSNDQLEQFAYVASHDLQEPLRMVASYTQLLAKRYKGRLDSDADEFIAFAVDGCNRMQGLIRDLLAYSRSGADRKAVHEISGDAALNEALVRLRVSIEDSGAIVTHDPLPDFVTDQTQLVQVFQNLVGNAIKYRGAAVPLVHVSAKNKGGKEWIFSVRDNGLGIAPEYFERIFIIFQRLHGKGEFEGTGIGLAICKKNVEQLGGRIWVESEIEKGSTFYFALPRTEGV